jgi:hypothetical protein
MFMENSFRDCRGDHFQLQGTFDRSTTSNSIDLISASPISYSGFRSLLEVSPPNMKWKCQSSGRDHPHQLGV